MKVFLPLFVLAASYAFADVMPEGSSQFVLAQALAARTQTTTTSRCPPARTLRGVQALCQNYEGRNLLLYMQRLDEVLFTQASYPDTMPELRELTLEPRTDYWIFRPEYGRYERTFDFRGGVYRIIYVPFNELSSNLTILYQPSPAPKV